MKLEDVVIVSMLVLAPIFMISGAFVCSKLEKLWNAVNVHAIFIPLIGVWFGVCLWLLLFIPCVRVAHEHDRMPYVQYVSPPLIQQGVPLTQYRVLYRVERASAAKHFNSKGGGK